MEQMRFSGLWTLDSGLWTLDSVSVVISGRILKTPETESRVLGTVSRKPRLKLEQYFATSVKRSSEHKPAANYTFGRLQRPQLAFNRVNLQRTDDHKDRSP